MLKPGGHALQAEIDTLTLPFNRHRIAAASLSGKASALAPASLSVREDAKRPHDPTHAAPGLLADLRPQAAGHCEPPRISSSEPGGACSGIERRRTIRIRRSALLEARMEQLDRPSIKIAENLDEYSQAFSVLHDVYQASGYLQQSHPSGLHFNRHHLLPRTCVFVFKSYLKVLSTMSYIPDTPAFGLPMDELYKAELDVLRDAGRKIVEIGSLATLRHRCGQNIMVFLSKAIFQYAHFTGADDLCIIINPKHAQFYSSIFLFKPFGEQRYYSKVDAMAVALRVDMHTIEASLRQAYAASDFDTDLHNFFLKINSHTIDSNMARQQVEKDKPLDDQTFRCLLSSHPELSRDLAPRQRAILETLYGVDLSSDKTDHH